MKVQHFKNNSNQNDNNVWLSLIEPNKEIKIIAAYKRLASSKLLLALTKPVQDKLLLCFLKAKHFEIAATRITIILGYNQ